MKKYLVSDKEDTELRRLAFQHQVWKPETDKLILNAGLLAKEKILDLGCGPGFITKELCAGNATEIWAVDSSKSFIEHLNVILSKEESRRVQKKIENALVSPLPEDYFDACISRWVLMFIPGPKEMVQKVYDALKPGGVFAIMEYGPFLNISLSPDSAIFNKIYKAVYELIGMWGGNADVGLLLPSLLSETGFSIEKITAVNKRDSPNSSLWKWIEQTSINHANLVENNLITPEDLDSYFRELKEYKEISGTRFSAPTVQQIIAVK